MRTCGFDYSSTVGLLHSPLSYTFPPRKRVWYICRYLSILNNRFMTQQNTESTQPQKAEGGTESADNSKRGHRRDRRRPHRRSGNPQPSADRQPESQAAPAVPPEVKGAQPQRPETQDSESSDKSGQPPGQQGAQRQSRRNRNRNRQAGASQTPAEGDSQQSMQGSVKGGGKSNGKNADKHPDKAPEKNGGKSGTKGHSKSEQKEREQPASILQRRLSRESKQHDTNDEPFVPAPQQPEAATVDAYIARLKGWQRELVTKLRTLIKQQASDASETILWSQPVFTLNGPVLYIKAFTDHVNLGFWRGNELDDSGNRLVGDLPTMRHVIIRNLNEFDKDLFEHYIRQAFKLSREKGDPTA